MLQQNLFGLFALGVFLTTLSATIGYGVFAMVSRKHRRRHRRL
jgi:hypothetical protein